MIGDRRFRAGLVVGAGVVAAALVAALPAFGADPAARVVTPRPAAQRLVCPGGAVTVGAAGDAAGEVSADGAASFRIAAADGRKVRGVELLRGNVTGSVSAGPRGVAGPAATSPERAITGAQSQSVSGGETRGFAAAACTRPVEESWLVAGATTTGRSSVVLLANPSATDAAVTLAVWTEHGRVAGTALGGVTVPARSRRAVALAGLAPNAGATAVRVRATGGQVTAVLQQRTVRGLESGGLDLAGPAAAPAKVQVVPGVRVAGSQAVTTAALTDGYADLEPVVRLLAPGRLPATVRIVATGADGLSGGGSLRRTLPAGVVTDVRLPGLVDGAYSVRVEGDRPIVAGVRISVITAPPDQDSTGQGSSTDAGTAGTGDTGSGDAGTSDADGGSDTGVVGGTDTGTIAGPGATGTSTDARGVDLAWYSSATPLGADAAVAVAAGEAPQLELTNTGRRAVTARLSGTTGGALRVPAGGTTAAEVDSGVIRILGAAGLYGAVTYSGDGAVAGYPVAPAGQPARAVRVTG